MRRMTVVITGGSSGIGLAAAEYYAQKGDTVYELSRSGEGGNKINHITADITDVESLNSAFKAIADKEGGIDILVNSAGYGISGAIEFTRLEDAQRQLDVNFFGTVRSVQQALPYLRKSRCASIVNVSSMGGPLALPFQAFYSCSKAAVNAYTLALANELRPFKIAVSAIMPGDVKTGFTQARQKNEIGAHVYGGTINKSVSSMEKDESNGMPPERIARKIYRMSKKRRPKPLYTVGVQYKLFALLNKILPARFINYIVGKLYA